MSKIRIKNFGPIKEGYQENDGWIDVKKVTVFIGNQGSGKSVLAKLITTFMWMEKALTRGDYEQEYFIEQFSKKNQSDNPYITYFRLENYFPKENSKSSVLEFQGESFNFLLNNGILKIEKANNLNYSLPQIMYVPAERNLIANVKTAQALKMTSDSLIEFVTEYDYAKEAINGFLPLPINDISIEHHENDDSIDLKGKDYKIKLTEASSGFQSAVPLFMVSWYLSELINSSINNKSELMTSQQRKKFRQKSQEINDNPNYSEEQKRILKSEEAKKFRKTAFINIVEEPEQNLFPSSQRHMLNSLVKFTNLSEGNKLIMTTHSPYIINYLTLSVKANLILNQINYLDKKKELNLKLCKIVPLRSTVKPDDLIIYELDEKDGTIKLLEPFNDLPSDENKLNERLSESNELFAQLLEIQQSL